MTDGKEAVTTAKEKIYFEGDTVIACTEYATRFFGVSAATLSNWAKDGCPRYEYGYWDIKAVTQYLQNKKDRKEAQTSVDDPDAVSLSGQKTMVERDLKIQQLKALERQNAIAEGKYLLRSQVVGELSEFCTVLKMSLQALGQELSTKVSPHVDAITARKVSNDIRSTIEAALEEMSISGVYPPKEE